MQPKLKPLQSWSLFISAPAPRVRKAPAKFPPSSLPQLTHLKTTGSQGRPETEVLLPARAASRRSVFTYFIIIVSRPKYPKAAVPSAVCRDNCLWWPFSPGWDSLIFISQMIENRKVGVGENLLSKGQCYRGDIRNCLRQGRWRASWIGQRTIPGNPCSFPFFSPQVLYYLKRLQI